MNNDQLRSEFEQLANKNAACGLNRSRRGTYVNPVIARDWKWFQLGALASPKEAPVTPQAAIPAAPSEPLSNMQIADCVTAVRPYSIALATVPAETLIAFVRNIEAALTQPTTVQQAEKGGV